jgi:hypothetical protein
LQVRIFVLGGVVLAALFAVTSGTMRPHFFSLLDRAWTSFRDTEGSSTTGLITNWVYPVVLLAITLFVVWARQGWAAVLNHWKQESLTALGVAVVVCLIMYGPVFVWHIVHIVYEDHMASVAASKPPFGQFKLNIGAAVLSVTDPPGKTIIELIVDIHNTGSDSIAHAWSLAVLVPPDKRFNGVHLSGRKPRLDTLSTQPLDDRLGNANLLSNGDASGSVSFLFNVDRRYLIADDNILDLSVLDRNNHAWHCERTIGDLKSEGTRHLLK